MARPIVVGSVVVPRGFTATPHRRFRVIRRDGDFLIVRPMADPESTRPDGLGREFPIHISEGRRPSIGAHRVPLPNPLPDDWIVPLPDGLFEREL